MTRWMKLFGIALAMMIALPALGQRGMGGAPGSPRYDPKTEVTVSGTVEAVKEYSSRGGWRTGQHVTLKTAQGSFDVHLGPTDFWKQHGFALAQGDTIEVTGSQTKVGDVEALIAREVKKGDKSVTLRDARGIPAWSRGRRTP